MNAEQFCAEYGHETRSGRVSFTKKVVENFIDIYTDFSYHDFTKEMTTRLKVSVMIDLYEAGCSYHYLNTPDLPPDKIGLPDFVFK